jgi:hypothetical protein
MHHGMTKRYNYIVICIIAYFITLVGTLDGVFRCQKAAAGPASAMGVIRSS